jgi:hypothetical protein
VKDLGYVHEVGRETGDVGKNLLPLAHRAASLLKRWLLGTHQGAVRASHLDYYLDEFTFRFNRGHPLPAENPFTELSNKPFNCNP